jgi:UDP-N-acetylmuramate--alanine ligase
VTVRGAADVGAGLAPAREARPIGAGERIHVVGAAGAGASAAALLASWAGAAVDGCDPGGPGPYTVALDGAGIVVAPAHDPAHVTVGSGGRPPSRLAVTKALTAIDPDNAELAAARDRSIPIEPWQQVVADAAAGRRMIGVAGTHGKSTSAGWLVHVLASAGRDPGAFVGALLPAGLTGLGVPATARRGEGDAFVVEADEYADNFDAYRPNVIVLTSAEWDHPDVFADRAAVLAAFEAWIRRAGEGNLHGAARGAGDRTVPVLVANVGDAGVAELVAGLADWPGWIVATALVDVAPQRVGSFARGIGERFRSAAGPADALLARITAAQPDATTIEIAGLDPLAGPLPVRLPTAGRHNAMNALGVAGAAAAVGVDAGAIAAGLAGFGGVGRRLERKGEAAGIVVYDDYGHHPTAIRETLAAVRQREPGRRVWAVYEPLTFHRTAALLDAFAEALARADAVAIADIWAGRDPDTSVSSAAGLAEAVARRAPAIPVAAPGTVEATAAWLAGEVRSGDAVLVMGGGRSYRIGELLLDHLKAR